MTRSEQLIKEVKKIFESEATNGADHETDESGESGLNEMARKAFNNTLTQKGKTEITKAVKAMIAEDKSEKKTEHAKTFYFKALFALAKAKVGEPILTTVIQEASGCKYPQPINKLLSQLVASEMLTRETSHVEPEPKEPGVKGRPKGPEKPAKEKATKLGGLPLVKKEKVSPSATDKDNDGKADSVINEDFELDENESLDEINLVSLEKKYTDQFGVDGNKKGETGELDEHEVNPMEVTRDNQTAIHPINESLLLMQMRAGIITDNEYAAKMKNRMLKY